MLSFMKKFSTLFDYGHQKEISTQKLEEENQDFEEELKQEKDGLDEVDITENETIKPEEAKCSRRTGVITSLGASSGTIDHTLFFDSSATKMFGDLKKGCQVEYTTYKMPDSDYVKVVKVEMTQDCSWDDAPSETEIRDTIESLKSGGAKYFNTHQRSILGVIAARNRQFLTIETDYKETTVDLDAVKIDFIPKEGDRVYLNCNVQTDENFVDLAGEILEVISVHPARKKMDQGHIKKLHNDWGVVDNNVYFTRDTIDAAVTLNVGDLILSEMIECERGYFSWRCLNMTILERAKTNQSTSPKVEANENKVVKTNKCVIQAVTVTDELRFIFQNAFETQKHEIELKNNSERVQKLTGIGVMGVRRNSQLRLEETNYPILIEPEQVVTVPIFCDSRFYGTTREKVSFIFNNFKVYRNIEISVGVDDDKENEEQKQSARSMRSRGYANQVWSKKGSQDIIPGTRLFANRRFIANKIGGFDVPDKLRDTLLVDCSRSEQISNLENLYPVLNMELDSNNYAQRFGLLLHIEEVEHFVNFRQYDREKAHFTREGEYLSLLIENLAERRPSLVLGDVVRATSPWADSSDNRAYDGFIHKVLSNRILVKFNPSFQAAYNDEDYRLEFYFSRYGYRKQHYAVQRIINRVDENFLFPQKIVLSDKLQLNAELDEEDNLLMDKTLSRHQWCNPLLNTVQKTAVKNILRGEARAMPYVIFGPPGTGKTMTIIETILQLILHLPNARILVGTPSNSSADLITTRLIDSKRLKPGDFVRMVSQRSIERDSIPDTIKPYCATADLGLEGTTCDDMVVTNGGTKLRCQMKYLGRHKITISTCATLGNFLQMDFPNEHFTHLILDESGQCTEPEMMAATCLLSPYFGQVILAGDPFQLGPIVVNNFAGDRGLRTSFLERIIHSFPYKRDKVRFPEAGCDPRLVTKLIYNYRALPSILQLYSNLFYDAELIPMKKPRGNRESAVLEQVQNILPPSSTRSKTHAVFFHGIRGENKQDSDSPSWYNPVEARHVFLIVMNMFHLKMSAHQIGIITPYQKQVKVLRIMFSEAGVSMPKIGSVEEFQGQERDIIIVSTVRSSKDFINLDLKFALGFACNPKRMNVAVSRARALLYICGNPHLLSLTDKWRELIEYCIRNDAYIGCDLPETLMSQVQSE